MTISSEVGSAGINILCRLKAGQHDSTLEAMKREIESLRRELEEERNLRRQAEVTPLLLLVLVLMRVVPLVQQEKLDRLEIKMSTASLTTGREHDGIPS